MKMRSCVAAMAALTTACSFAVAQTANFTIFENADGVAVDGIDISVELIELDGQVEFKFSNDSTMSARVTTIYFESTEFTLSSLLNPLIVNNNEVSYTDEKVAPGSPAGSIKHTEGGDWGGTFYGLAPNKPQPNLTALSPGEMVSVIFDLEEDVTVAEVFSQLNDVDEGFRISMHIQSIGESGASVWAVNPTPGPIALLALGGLVATRRRRVA